MRCQILSNKKPDALIYNQKAIFIYNPLLAITKKVLPNKKNSPLKVKLICNF